MSQADRPVIITALPVAFDRDGRLNIEGTRQIFKKAAASGVQGGLPLGTTGEFASLSVAERGEVLEVAVDEFTELRCVAHVGAASAYEVRQLIGQAQVVGVKELALLTPYYMPATDSEMLHFFEECAQATGDTRIYVYAFRARTGNRVSNELMHDVSQIPNIVGAKISGETIERVGEYREVVSESFDIYTGGDADLMRVGQFGVQGVISGNASALPRPFTHLAGLINSAAGSDELADAQAAVDDVCDVLKGDLARLKAALRLQGIDAGFPRMPIDEPDDAAMRELERIVDAYGSDSGDK